MKVRCRNLGFLGFPNYKVGGNGSVWTRWSRRGKTGPWKKLTLRVFKDTGRVYVDLCKGNRELGNVGRGKSKRFLVHRLVLEAFVGLCPPGMQCRHFPDPDPRNNWVGNLQWGSQSENEADKFVHGTSNVGERNGRAKLSNKKAARMRRLWATGRYYQRELAAMFHTTQGNVSMIVNNSTFKVTA